MTAATPQNAFARCSLPEQQALNNPHPGAIMPAIHFLPEGSSFNGDLAQD